jgi:hypothetical protein
VLQAKYLPLPHFSATHHINIRQSPEKIWPLVQRLDYGSSKLIRFLFALRGMPARMMNLGGMEKARFITLESSQNETIIGLIGQFWKPGGNLQLFTPEEFVQYDRPGFLKATWSFTLTGGDTCSKLATETRVYCIDEAAKRRFRPYWFIVKPFSGIIRMEILKGIRKKAERS